MPLPDKMGYVLTPTEKTTIIDALNLALTTLNTIKVVQLTAKERQGAQSVAEYRLPYTENAIISLAPQYPNLQPPFMPLTDATKDLTMSLDLREISLLVKEVNDRFVDFSLASEHFAFEYLLKFYAIAKEAQSVNTPGADTVVETLKPLFEGQGVQNEPVPNP
jgi:hypothetical protein